MDDRAHLAWVVHYAEHRELVIGVEARYTRMIGFAAGEREWEGTDMARGRRGLARLGAGVLPVSELMSIVRELSFDELRDEAQTPPRLLLIGADGTTVERLRDELGGPVASTYIEVANFDRLPGDLTPYDGIVLVNATPADRGRPEIRSLLTNVETAGRTLTFQLPPAIGRDDTPALPAEAVEDLRGRLVTRLGHRQLALGRHLPPFRRAVATQITNATARANAEFALLSNIPAVVPIVGNIMAAGADFLVLTKNQLMLIYKLAAIHGRDISQPWRLYTEMLPVVGAGFLWRTVARELAAFLPFAAGTIPKVLVAYAGTAVTGQGANFFYEQGERPSGEQMRGFYGRAIEIARALRFDQLRNKSDGRKVIEGQFKEAAPPRQLAGQSPVENGATRATTGLDTPPASVARPPVERPSDRVDRPS